MPKTLKQYMSQQISDVRQRYLEDLAAMPEDWLARSPGGAARTPYDFTYEVVYVNGRIAKRLAGEDPGPPSSETWIKAPAEFQRKDEAIRQFDASMQLIQKLWDDMPDEALESPIQMANGNTTSPLDLASLAYSHAYYHDAQLNYAQAIAGDEEVHWS